MFQQGDAWLADLGDEVRQPVFIVSDERFHRLASRAIVAPLVRVDPDEVSTPWRVPFGDKVIALDYLRTIPTGRLLELVERPPAHTLQRVRRALRSVV